MSACCKQIFPWLRLSASLGDRFRLQHLSDGAFAPLMFLSSNGKNVAFYSVFGQFVIRMILALHHSCY